MYCIESLSMPRKQMLAAVSVEAVWKQQLPFFVRCVRVSRNKGKSNMLINSIRSMHNEERKHSDPEEDRCPRPRLQSPLQLLSISY